MSPSELETSASTKKFDFFICHAHEEYDIAKAIKVAFDEFDITSFVAHKTIPTGRDWHLEIQKKLLESENILILATKSLDGRSQYCHYEIGFAESAGLTKYILFLDEMRFPPYVDYNIQGYRFKANNVESELKKIFKELVKAEIDTKKFVLAKTAIENYIRDSKFGDDLLARLKKESIFDPAAYADKFEKLGKYGRLAILSEILTELNSQERSRDYNVNLSRAIPTLLSSEESDEDRERFIRRAFDFMANNNSYGLQRLFFEICDCSFARRERDLLRQKYLDFIIDTFVGARNFSEANPSSKLIAQLKGDYSKDQLEKLYAGLVSNSNLYGGFDANPAVVSVLKLQVDLVPDLIKELAILEADKFKITENTEAIFIRLGVLKTPIFNV